MRPRHYRRVWLAGHRTGWCDEQGVCNDWIMHNLKEVRRDAWRAGNSREAVDDWTMDGLMRGRSDARQVQQTSAAE